MSKPVDELTKLKNIKIERLEGELQDALQQEKNNKKFEGGWQEISWGGEGNPWGERSQQISEKIQFLKDGLARPVSDKIIGGIEGEHTKEEFQQNIRRYVFHTNPGGQEAIRLIGWTIPSLDNIKLPQLFKLGVGYIQRPNNLEEFHRVKTPISGYSNCNVELSRCRIRTLGTVEFPPFAYTINLSDNDIIHLNHVQFGRCVEINLARNFISTLRGSRFSEGTTNIELQDNFISRIEDLNIDSLPRTLERIGLAGNPITDGLTEEQHQALQQEILQRIRTPVRNPPAPSAPPLDPGDEAKPHFEFGGPFFGGSVRKTKKTRKPVRKLRRKNRKTNKMRISKNIHKK